MWNSDFIQTNRTWFVLFLSSFVDRLLKSIISSLTYPYESIEYIF